MKITNHDGKQIELSFGLKTLTMIDKELGFEMQGANLGEGLEMLIPKLNSGNLIAVSKIIKAAASHNKNAPDTDEKLETILDNIAENEGFKGFGEQVIEELGKRPMTAQLLPEEQRPAPKKAVKSKANLQEA